MSQEKAAEIISLAATREAAPTAIGDEKAGVFLANARERAGFSLEDVSEAIKVKIAHLESIEKTRPDLLPPRPYAVGFVKVYAQYLGLDANAVVERFKDDINAAAPAPIEPVRQEIARHESAAMGEGVKMASIFGILAVLIFAVWIAFQIAGGNRADHRAPAQEAAPRVRLNNVPAPRPTLLSPKAAPVESTFASQPETQTAETAVEPAAKNLTSDALEQTRAPVETLLTDDTDATAAVEPLSTPLDEPQEAALATALAPQPQAQPEPAAPTRTAMPLRDPVIVPAKPERTVGPVYPIRCDTGAAELESVTVLFNVTAAGRPDNIRVVSSTNACFEEEAVRTIGRWRFHPRTVDGAPRLDPGKKATVNFRR